jgi:hypothetical protein
MTVRELETRMESRELNEWMAYFNLEPWGQVQADYRAGVIASTIVNVNGGLKGRKPAKATDFFPLYRLRGEQSPEEQMQILKKLAEKTGG